MEIIPAIDIIDGKCVRLTEGDYGTKKEYAAHPLEVAKKFEAAGIRRLHLVDLDGAKARKVVNWDVVEQIVKHTSLLVDFGGGVQSDEDIERLFEVGVRQVTGGSIAVRQESIFVSWIKKYGPEKIILGADVKEERIAISGWEENTGLLVFDFLQKFLDLGIQEVICTDISKDGMMQGPSFDLYGRIMSRFPSLKLIASGGVTTASDIEELRGMGIYGAIIGKAIYEKTIELEEFKPYL